MTMDGAGLSQPQPPPPHEQQQPQTDPASPPQQQDNVDREMQDWLTRDEQLGDTYLKEVERTVENNVDCIKFSQRIRNLMAQSMQKVVMVKLLGRPIGH
ncbi:hypothetical protein Scep_010545 [Stephania cephalantha]|uniref:Uncharacterized protein n=1 Tax=Stephania cephalantha TaxID=152367 RepID=A0AAP0JVZ8_9MAGN